MKSSSFVALVAFAALIASVGSANAGTRISSKSLTLVEENVASEISVSKAPHNTGSGRGIGTGRGRGIGTGRGRKAALEVSSVAAQNVALPAPQVAL